MNPSGWQGNPQGWYPPQPPPQYQGPPPHQQPPPYQQGPPMAAPPTPGRGIAITTIVLSFGGVIAAIFGLGSAVLLGVFTADSSSSAGHWISPALAIGLGAASLCYGALLCAGAILLLRRRLPGRYFVVAGCAVAIALSLLSLAFVSSLTGQTTASSLFGFVFPIATAVFALLPGTRDWCTGAGPQHPQPPQQYPPYPQPPQQGYGQSF